MSVLSREMMNDTTTKVKVNFVISSSPFYSLYLLECLHFLEDEVPTRLPDREHTQVHY